MNFILLHTVIFLLLFGSGKVEGKNRESRNRTKSHEAKSLKRSQKLKKEEIVKILVLLPEDERFLFRKSFEKF